LPIRFDPRLFWLHAGSTNRKSERAADRVAVGGDHAPTQEMRAPSESLRQRHGERGVLCCSFLELAGITVRPDETQDDGRYRLVENERHNGGRLCHHRAIGRVAANE